MPILLSSKEKHERAYILGDLRETLTKGELLVSKGAVPSQELQDYLHIISATVARFSKTSTRALKALINNECFHADALIRKESRLHYEQKNRNYHSRMLRRAQSALKEAVARVTVEGPSYDLSSGGVTTLDMLEHWQSDTTNECLRAFALTEQEEDMTVQQLTEKLWVVNSHPDVVKEVALATVRASLKITADNNTELEAIAETLSRAQALVRIDREPDRSHLLKMARVSSNLYRMPISEVVTWEPLLNDLVLLEDLSEDDIETLISLHSQELFGTLQEAKESVLAL